MTRPMMTVDAVNEVVRKLHDLDRRALLTDTPRLAEQDMTWLERSQELLARVNLLVADGPSQDMLDAIAAHVIAYKLALAAAEELRVESGEAA